MTSTYGQPARSGTDRGAAVATVSIVIPCHNYGRFLGAAVHSALTQRGVDVDIIIVDDASSDDSLTVARSLARAEPRIRVIEHPVNLGPVQTFNDGLALATGEFLVRLDADDLLTPGSLKRSATVARALPSVGLVYGHPLHFAGPEPPAARSTIKGWTVWSGTDWLEDHCRSGVNVITSPEAFMRKSVVDRVGGQRPLAHTHDMEMWLRLAAVSDVAYLRGPDQAWHREHEGGLSNTARSPVGITILEERRAAFRTLFDNPSLAIRDADRLSTTAARTLAREALGRAAYEFDRGRANESSTGLLIDFAARTYPDFKQLPEWRKLARRLRWGERWLLRHPWHLARPLVRIVTDRIRDRRWNRTGLYERG